MLVAISYLVFAVAGLAAFRFWPPRTAALVVFFGGWVILPVGDFPPPSAPDTFAYWIVGLALPSDMLVSKAWVAPCTALAGSMLTAAGRGRLRALELTWLDAPVALWCLWPLLQWAIGRDGNPAGPLACAYLIGSWGATWLLGRLYGGDATGRRAIVTAVAYSALACLPFSLLEGSVGPFIYDALYGTHPLRFVGAHRYVGFRPVGFFEDGNQFGLWIAIGAVAALWLAWSAAGRTRTRAWLVAAVLIAMVLAAQSVGAALLALLAVALLAAARIVDLRPVFIGAFALVVLAGAVMLSGRVPIRQIATETAIGRGAVDAFRAVGRDSLPWRIAQEQRLLRPAFAHPLAGSAQWDWWRDEHRRPWGMVLLVIGQFGLIGLAAGLATPLAPAGQALLRRAPPDRRRAEPAVTTLIAVLIGVALLDALLNSFIYFPAILLAGALASRGPGTPSQ
ncbi:MAG TPA: hypothetical protein VIO33_02150 [Burkholderiaceae bacterium]